MINESKTLTTRISCKYKCEFDEKNVIQIYGALRINVDVSVKNVIYGEKNYVCSFATCNFENGKCLAGITGDSAIKCHEVIES